MIYDMMVAASAREYNLSTGPKLIVFVIQILSLMKTAAATMMKPITFQTMKVICPLGVL